MRYLATALASASIALALAPATNPEADAYPYLSCTHAKRLVHPGWQKRCHRVHPWSIRVWYRLGSNLYCWGYAGRLVEWSRRHHRFIAYPAGQACSVFGKIIVR